MSSCWRCEPGSCSTSACMPSLPAAFPFATVLKSPEYLLFWQLFVSCVQDWSLRIQFLDWGVSNRWLIEQLTCSKCSFQRCSVSDCFAKRIGRIHALKLLIQLSAIFPLSVCCCTRSASSDHHLSSMSRSSFWSLAFAGRNCSLYLSLLGLHGAAVKRDASR